MVFGKLRHKHQCNPRVFAIQEVHEEVGGEAWILSAEQFDELFCNQIVWKVKHVIWGIYPITERGESMRIYRGPPESICKQINEKKVGSK